MKVKDVHCKQNRAVGSVKNISQTKRKKEEVEMKKILQIVLALVLLCVMVGVAVAEERAEIGASGKVYTTQGEPRRPLTEVEKQAVNNPGKEIPVDLRNIKAKRDVFSWPGFFYIIPVQEYTRVAVYDKEKQAITVVEKKGKIYGEKLFALHIVPLVAMIVIMAISSISFIRKDDLVAILGLTFVVFIFSVFVYTIYVVALAAVVLAAVVFVFTFVVFVADLNKTEKVYKALSAISCITATIVMFV